MEIVVVKWSDATSVDAWEDIEVASKNECHNVTSVGLKLVDNEHKVVIALNWDRDNKSVSQSLVIPKLWIKSIEQIGIVDDFR